jgi:hypothetical protein
LQLLDPVSDLLKTISKYANGDIFSDARDAIDKVSTPMRNVSDLIRSFAVDKVDSFQAKWLSAPADGELPKVQKFMNYAYYVSVCSC